MIQIEDTAPQGTAWLRLGFRPFFLAALAFGVIAMLVWLVVFSRFIELPLAGLSPLAWHGHEMIFGYSMAVITGFLLTAVRNWTGVDTVRGVPMTVPTQASTRWQTRRSYPAHTASAPGRDRRRLWWRG